MKGIDDYVDERHLDNQLKDGRLLICEDTRYHSSYCEVGTRPIGDAVLLDVS